MAQERVGQVRGAADPLDAAVGLVDDLGQVGDVRLASSTALKLDHSPSTGLRSGVVLVGHAFVQNLRRGHCELAVEEPANPAADRRVRRTGPGDLILYGERCSARLDLTECNSAILDDADRIIELIQKREA